MRVLAGLLLALGLVAPPAPLPDLTQPVNDFANIVDASSATAIENMIRTLKASTGDVVVVATVPDIGSYGDVREYANKLFENHGRGIGEKGKNNGLLILLALKERRVQIEVGYELEQWITDGFSGETSRTFMAPAFREGHYGDGLRLGTARVIARVAQGRGVTLQGVRAPAEREAPGAPMPLWLILLVFVAILIISRFGGGPGSSIGRWGGGGFSGWSSGVGSFGGGGGGGFGGGFGGFGGGSSGGGGGGSSW